jgi:prepilin-type N-terminal cleavage/methylation domain-containing protein
MSHRHGQRPGFTLVEVMLTTVLAAVLLLALWSLLSMYSKAFEGGHARTEQSQLARVLLEQINTDLQNVLVTPQSTPPTAGPGPQLTSPGAASGTVSPPQSPTTANSPSPTSPRASTAPAATTPSATTVSPTAARPKSAAPAGPPAAPPSASPPLPNQPAPFGDPNTLTGGDLATTSLRPAGLYGSATFLQIDVVQPAMLAPKKHDPEVQLLDPESPSQADELKTVIYTFEEYRDPANPTVEPTTRLVRQELSWAQAHPARGSERSLTDSREPLAPGPTDSLTDSSGPAGLVSTKKFEPTQPEDPSGIDPLSESSEFETGTATTIPEVFEFALRYFDGAVWSEEWDSASRKSLPVAIEVSFRLQSPEEAAKPAGEETVKDAGVDLAKVEQLKHPLQRLLIPIALAPKSAGQNIPPGGQPVDDLRFPPAAEAHASFK